ncbi:MAG: glycosyltransferase [Acidimicrobiales bacterium]
MARNPHPDVAIISPYPDSNGSATSGVAWYTRDLAHALHAKGAGVTVVAPAAGAGPAVPEPGNPFTVRRPFRRGAAALPAAARAAVATGAPVVHLQHEMFLYGGAASIPGLLPALAYLRASRRGTVVTMHQVVDPGTVDAGFTALHRVPVPAPVARTGLAAVQALVGSAANATIVHEPAFARALRRSAVLPLGMHPPAGQRSRDTARRTLGLPEGRLVVLCFGFVAPYKGLEAALAAAEMAGPEMALVVAGDEHPRLRGQGYRGALEARWGHAARFVGHVPDAQVAVWFSAADVALLAYPRPFSSSAVLGLAVRHGTPALLSEAMAAVCGAPTEMAVDIAPTRLCQRLRALASDPPALGRLGQLTAGLAAGRTWPEVAAQHLRIYEEVNDGRCASRRSPRH